MRSVFLGAMDAAIGLTGALHTVHAGIIGVPPTTSSNVRGTVPDYDFDWVVISDPGNAPFNIDVVNTAPGPHSSMASTSSSSLSQGLVIADCVFRLRRACAA